MKTLLLMALLAVTVQATEMTYWKVSESGELVQITEQQQKETEKRERIKHIYIPTGLGLLGWCSLTPIGVILGTYILIMASDYGN